MSIENQPEHTLMNEVLPEAEPFDPSLPPRERVRRHLRKLASFTGGAIAATQLCYCVVDMLPPPTECNTSDSPNPSDLVRADASVSVDEATSQREVLLILSASNVMDFSWSEEISVTGGSLIHAAVGDDGSEDTGEYVYEDALYVRILVDEDVDELTVQTEATCGNTETLTWVIRLNEEDILGTELQDD